MTMFRVGPAGIPGSLKTDMNTVLNKKFGTTGQDYPPADWPADVNLMGPLPEKTIVSSPIADFSDGADDVPTKSLIVTIPPTLSGVSSVTETQTGRNILDASTVSSGTGTIWYEYDNGILFKAGVTYTFSAKIPYNTGSIAIYGIDHSTQLAYAYIDNTTPSKVIFTPTVDTYGCPRLYSVGLTAQDITEAQINIGSTVEAYTAYTAPTVYTASLGRTIHGGSVDVVNGTGTETHTTRPRK